MPRQHLRALFRDLLSTTPPTAILLQMVMLRVDLRQGLPSRPCCREMSSRGSATNRAGALLSGMHVRCNRGSEIETCRKFPGVEMCQTLLRQNGSTQENQKQDFTEGKKLQKICMPTLVWHFNAELVCLLVVVLWEDDAFYGSALLFLFGRCLKASRVPALKCRSKYSSALRLKCSLEGLYMSLRMELQS